MRSIHFCSEPLPRDAFMSSLHEAEVVGFVEDSLSDAFGSWEVTLLFSVANERPAWVVDCLRLEDRCRLRMHVDPKDARDAVAFRVALGSLGAHQAPRATALNE